MRKLRSGWVVVLFDAESKIEDGMSQFRESLVEGCEKRFVGQGTRFLPGFEMINGLDGGTVCVFEETDVLGLVSTSPVTFDDITLDGLTAASDLRAFFIHLKLWKAV